MADLFFAFKKPQRDIQESIIHATMKSSHRFLAIFVRRKRLEIGWGVLFIVGFRIPTQCFFFDLQDHLKKGNKQNESSVVFWY